MLGPMVNPAFPKKQMVGVFSLELARLYAYLYQQTDKSFVIIHTLDGYDEVSLPCNCTRSRLNLFTFFRIKSGCAFTKTPTFFTFLGNDFNNASSNSSPTKPGRFFIKNKTHIIGLQRQK